MKKILFSALLLIGCNSAPEGFCDCLEQGEKLNKVTNEVLSGDLSNAKKDELLKARKEKEKLCAPFVEANGAEMREWKKSCED
jgi:hypothetical protein|tara:strand:- start:5375 stop:5623 length:249 start_codon:yes stop_codon:yes gene_type:complete